MVLSFQLSQSAFVVERATPELSDLTAIYLVCDSVDWPFRLGLAEWLCRWSGWAHSHSCGQRPGWLGASWSRAPELEQLVPAPRGLILLQTSSGLSTQWQREVSASRGEAGILRPQLENCTV